VGTSTEQGVIDELSRPPWVNVGDRPGIRLIGNGLGEYRNRHHWQAYQVIADDLVLALASARPLVVGESAGTLAALLTPGQAARDTGTATDIDSGTVTRRLTLQGRRPRLLAQVAEVNVSGACRLEATETSLYVTASADGCRVRVASATELSLRNGEIHRIEFP
jgi:hypothetical protein